MGWTDAVGRKVGRLLLDSSQPILSQLHLSPRSSPAAAPEARDSIDSSDPSASCTEEFQGPDTSSLSAFIYSFLTSSPRRQSEDDNRQKSEEDPDWCLVSPSELDSTMIREDYFANAAAPVLPSMSEESCLLSEKFRAVLYPALPIIVKGRHWVLLYSTARDGISLLTLYRKSSLLPGPCLLVAGDTNGAVFGGLLQGPLKPSKKRYQGSNQTFVFTDISGQPKVFLPTGLNRYYFLCTNDSLAIGGGGHFALHLESDLLSGSSGSCETFGTGCLAHSEEFELKDVELWGFAHISRHRPPSNSGSV